MHAMSSDLRRRVLSLYKKGYRTSWIAQILEVSPSWVRRVRQRWREHGETTARRRGGSEPTRIDRRRLEQLIAQQPDATLEELRDRLGVSCSLTTVWNASRRLGHAFKKSRVTPPNRIARMSSGSEPTGRADYGGGSGGG